MSQRGVPPDALWELAARQLARGGTFRLRARGQSMRPTIPDGSLVTLGPVAPGAVRVGDVVLVQVGDGASLHRVVARWAGLVWTKGDLNPWRDPPVPAASVIGRALSVALPETEVDQPLTAGRAWAVVAWLTGLRSERMRERRP